MSYTRMEPLPDTGCAGCDSDPAKSLRAFCGACRTQRGLATCVLCGDRGWRSQPVQDGSVWARCGCQKEVLR